MKEKVWMRYRVRNSEGELDIYKGEQLIGYKVAVPNNLRWFDIPDVTKSILDKMGYKCRWTGKIEPKKIEFGEVEYVDGVSENLASKDKEFINKWNALLRRVFNVYGRSNVFRIKEIDENTFEVMTYNGNLEVTTYTVEKTESDLSLFEDLDIFNKYNVYVN